MDYSKYKPIHGEECYVDWEADTGMWGIFGLDSGFCYKLSSDKEEVEKILNQNK